MSALTDKPLALSWAVGASLGPSWVVEEGLPGRHGWCLGNLSGWANSMFPGTSLCHELCFHTFVTSRLHSCMCGALSGCVVFLYFRLTVSQASRPSLKAVLSRMPSSPSSSPIQMCLLPQRVCYCSSHSYPHNALQSSARVQALEERVEHPDPLPSGPGDRSCPCWDGGVANP